MEQLIGAAIDIAAGKYDVLIADKMCQCGIDCGHAGIEVPGHVVPCQGSGFKVDNMVGEADRSRVQESGVDVVHQLPSLEGVFDPFDASVEIGCSPGDHRCRTKDRR